jgi:hypothetical protein
VSGVATAAVPTVTLALRSQEARFLAGLVTELRTLVAAPAVGDDPLEAWAAEMGAQPIDHSDPVVERLFPSAYRAADQDAEYRRLTETSLRVAKDQDALTVMEDLRGARATRVTFPADHAPAWLRTLNALRLALAVRLEIATAADADALDNLAPADPRFDVAQIYHWLGYLLELTLDQLA